MTSGDRPLEGQTVLIVEDSWQLADAMRRVVELAGGIVVGLVGTIEDLERYAREANFDSVVMDLNLHEAMAHGIAFRLADEGRKVVVLTGYERPTVTRVHEWLTKPVAAKDVIEALARPLAR